ncbi:MAG: proton-conducting transporter membrane subunit [Candidatus Zixiibacteriota bacterium]
MVSPIYIFIIALLLAFLLSIFDKIGRKFSYTVLLIGLGFISWLSIGWLWELASGAIPVNVYTAGFKPPFSINLRLGLIEAFVITAVNILGFFSAIFMAKQLKENHISFMVLLLMVIMGVNGMVMTRDIFNLFVFMEITSIATYGLLGLKRDGDSLSAGFKYIIAGGLASGFFLIGVAYIYRLAGHLSIDFMLNQTSNFTSLAGMTALFLVLIALIIELKPFPANGWALDVYQTASPGIASIIAVGTSAGMIMAAYKILPLMQKSHLMIISIIGLITFLASNLMGIKQKNAKRMLGYSSIAQMGLLLAATAFTIQFELQRQTIFIILGGIFINHFIAKAGMFWLSGIVREKDYRNWGQLASQPCLLMAFGIFAFALIGLPPFPGFFGKWALLTAFSAQKLYILIGIVLLGSLFEAVYLLRWLGIAAKGTKCESGKCSNLKMSQFAPIMLFVLFIFLIGIFMGTSFDLAGVIQLSPIVAAGFFYLIRNLNGKIKGFLAMLIIAIYGLYAYFMIAGGVALIFGAMFVIGSLILTFATMYRKEKRPGFYIYLMLMVLPLGNLLFAKYAIEFFAYWEFMTIGSYLLVLRGKKGLKPALSYIIFSLAAGFLILGGFSLISGGDMFMPIYNMEFMQQNGSTLAFSLIAIGFLIKSAAIGVHIWLPGAYAEAEDDSSAFISAILSKAGIFGLMLFGLFFGGMTIAGASIMTIIGWIGVITALLGALFAVFQEDIKKLLAYSSMSQIGYIILMFSMNNHSGWTSALYLSINHLIIKALLFLVAAGIIYRTGTRKMYRMGGLIKKMPVSFIALLIGIIALSGVPPLSGFGGKWLIYVSLIENGLYLQAGMAFFASTIAFLYLFRLINTVFLGQLKQRYQDLKEANLWLLIPQMIMVAAIMVISVFPSTIIKPISSMVGIHFKPTMHFDGFSFVSDMGYWNATAIMVITMVIFTAAFIWLLLVNRGSKKIGQLNIVYAAERPDRPETTHFAHNFFAHYQKALGFLAAPLASRFWNGVSDGVHAIASAVRNIYTGNGQTYAIHIVLFVGIVYLIFRGI